jgi:hypothetical protein
VLSRERRDAPEKAHVCGLARIKNEKRACVWEPLSPGGTAVSGELLASSECSPVFPYLNAIGANLTPARPSRPCHGFRSHRQIPEFSRPYPPHPQPFTSTLPANAGTDLLAPLCYNPIRRSPRKRPDLLCSLTTEYSHHPQWDWVRSVILPIPRPAQTTARSAKPDPLVLLNWLRSCKFTHLAERLRVQEWDWVRSVIFICVPRRPRRSSHIGLHSAWTKLSDVKSSVSVRLAGQDDSNGN